MQLEEEKTLSQQGSYHHQVTCSSTNSRLWYLKVHLVQPLTAGSETIPLDQFRWEAVTTNGRGNLAHPNQFTPFTLIPDTVYISGSDEASGTAITFQFRYQLKIPAAQMSGIYSTTIRYTLAEVL
jgi:hypothetical protein